MVDAEGHCEAEGRVFKLLDNGKALKMKGPWGRFADGDGGRIFGILCTVLFESSRVAVPM